MIPATAAESLSPSWAELQIDYRSKESFAYAQECRRIWGHLEEVLDWCKSELLGDWRWQVVETSNDIRPGRYVFYFDSDRDYLAFVLKWG